MRVENPEFTAWGVICEHCPFGDEAGKWVDDANLVACLSTRCPRNMEEYTTACLMAEEAAKGGKG